MRILQSCWTDLTSTKTWTRHQTLIKFFTLSLPKFKQTHFLKWQIKQLHVLGILTSFSVLAHPNAVWNTFLVFTVHFFYFLIKNMQIFPIFFFCAICGHKAPKSLVKNLAVFGSFKNGKHTNKLQHKKTCQKSHRYFQTFLCYIYSNVFTQQVVNQL